MKDDDKLVNFIIENLKKIAANGAVTDRLRALEILAGMLLEPDEDGGE